MTAQAKSQLTGAGETDAVAWATGENTVTASSVEQPVATQAMTQSRSIGPGAWRRCCEQTAMISTKAAAMPMTESACKVVLMAPNAAINSATNAMDAAATRDVEVRL
ncbi:hypothetical protein D9M72_534020 [compost metagenome]